MWSCVPLYARPLVMLTFTFGAQKLTRSSLSQNAPVLKVWSKCVQYFSRYCSRTAKKQCFLCWQRHNNIYEQVYLPSTDKTILYYVYSLLQKLQHVSTPYCISSEHSRLLFFRGLEFLRLKSWSGCWSTVLVLALRLWAFIVKCP